MAIGTLTFEGERRKTMHHFEYAVTTHASLKTAWKLYTDWSRWPSFASIYGRIEWSQGRPWDVGSHMDIEILRPLHTVIDHLIIVCEEEHEIAWIDRAMGITICQRVEFEALPSGKTRIRTWGDVSPDGAVIDGKPVSRLVDVFMETWYENFRFACDASAQVLA
jgi:hypothetical protein